MAMFIMRGGCSKNVGRRNVGTGTQMWWVVVSQYVWNYMIGNCIKCLYLTERTAYVSNSQESYSARWIWGNEQKGLS
jgi:hypothetical protein